MLKKLFLYSLFFICSVGWGGACNYQVSNRGKIPSAFYEEVLTWSKTASDEIFTVNNNFDVLYSIIQKYNKVV